MAAIFDALHLNWWSMLFQIINLLILAGLLYLILYKPVTQMVAEREQRIEGGLAAAAEAKEQAQAVLAQYQEQMQGARQQSQEIIEQARQLGERMREEIVSQARQEAEKMLARAKGEIEASREQALAQIRAEAATLAVLAAGKIIEREITPEDHRRLAESVISEAGKLQ